MITKTYKTTTFGVGKLRCCIYMHQSQAMHQKSKALFYRPSLLGYPLKSAPAAAVSAHSVDI